MHLIPTVRGPGAAIALGWSVSIITVGHLWSFVWLAAATLVATAVGLADDLSGLGTHTRIAWQSLIGATLCILLWASGAVSALWIPIGLMVVVIVINVTNFMDGVNGITGMHAICAGIIYSAMGAAIDSRVVTLGGAALSAASLGFLPFNAIGGRVFPGDAGSYGVGSSIAALAILTASAGHPVAAAAPLVIYVTDTGSTLVSRALRGEYLLAAHKEHIYQRLAAGSFGHLGAAAFVTFASGCCGVLGLVLTDGLISVLVCVAGCTLVASAYGLTSAKFLSDEVTTG